MPDSSINSVPAGTTASKWSVCLIPLRAVNFLLGIGVGVREEFCIAKKQGLSVSLFQSRTLHSP